MHLPIVYPTIAVFTLVILWLQFSRSSIHPINSPGGKHRVEYFNGVWNFERDANNLLLSERQCDLAFPGLFKEVDRSVKHRKDNHVSLSEIDNIKISNGYVRGMIYNQQVSIQLLCYQPGMRTNESVLPSYTSSINTAPSSLANMQRSQQFTAPSSHLPNPFQISNSHFSQTISCVPPHNGHTLEKTKTKISGSCPTSDSGHGLKL